MSDITLINDSEQSQLVTNGLAVNGELYLKKEGSTDAGAIVVYDSGSWRTFADETVSGFVNQYSVSFDGTNDYMEVSSTSLTNGLSNLTISFWLKRSINGNDNIFGNRSSGGINAQMYSNYLYFFITGDGYLKVPASTSTFSTNAWHHFALVFNGSGSSSADKAKAYIDGTEITQSTNTITGTTITSTTANLFVGSDPLVTNAPWQGLVDEFALINSALSSSDITSIYNSGVAADLSSYSPIGWWSMGDNDSGTGTTITDQGSGGNDGTLINGPTFSTDIPS
jgi:hypothetical protein